MNSFPFYTGKIIIPMYPLFFNGKNETVLICFIEVPYNAACLAVFTNYSNNIKFIVSFDTKNVLRCALGKS